MQPDGQSWRARFKEWTRRVVNGPAMHGINRFFARHSTVPTTPLVDPETFPWLSDLEQEWPTIRAELVEVLALREHIPALSDIETGQMRIAGEQGWHTFFLHGFGEKSRVGCQVCPQTARLLQSVPGLQSAFFSILEPGKQIPEHRGVYRGFLRGHLGLVVPTGAGEATLRFPSEEVHAQWKKGQTIIFDDWYPHDVVNTLEETRVVLLFDFERPMRFPASRVNRVLLWLIRKSSFVQDARINQARWEKRYLDAWNQRLKSAELTA
jgi:aspartyl/asparaginyl beta-hydroxylase (cupin superfamily)